MALTRLRGNTFLTLRGPETKATTLDCPAEGERLGILFKLGTFMPQLLPLEAPRPQGCDVARCDEPLFLAKRE
jgi:hypothetical protein